MRARPPISGAEGAMANTYVLRVGRIVAMLLVATLSFGAPIARGQNSVGDFLPAGLLPLLSNQPNNQPAANAVSTAVCQAADEYAATCTSGSAHRESRSNRWCPAVCADRSNG